MIRQVFRVELLHDKQDETDSNAIYSYLKEIFLESEIIVEKHLENEVVDTE